MRVPIENGSGLFNQVSDLIKLPAAEWEDVNYEKNLFYHQVAGDFFFISAKHTINVCAFGKTNDLLMLL